MLSPKRIAIVVCIVACSAPAVLHAQRQVRRTTIIGKVTNITPTSMFVQTTIGVIAVDLANQGLIINGAPVGPAKVEFNGSMNVKDLKPGMLVGFDADVKARRKIESKVERISVLNPRTARAGISPVGVDAGDNPVNARMRIVGQVTRNLKDALVVRVPDGRTNRSMRAELAEKVVIQVTDISQARLGDEVEVTGYQEIPAAGGRPSRQVWAMNVKIKRGAGPGEAVAAGGKPGRDPFKAAAEPDAGDDAAKPKRKGKILKIN